MGATHQNKWPADDLCASAPQIMTHFGVLTLNFNPAESRNAGFKVAAIENAFISAAPLRLTLPLFLC
jgi:hypothetical protein